MTIPEWYWAAWFLIGFGVPEAISLFNTKKGDTLSEYVRHWFATDIDGRSAKTRWNTWRRLSLVLGLAWLCVHWLTNGTFI